MSTESPHPSRSRASQRSAAGNGPLDDRKRFLLASRRRRPTDSNLRATFRKQLVDIGDSVKVQMREYHDVTAIGYSRQFSDPKWMNDAAIDAILEYGGG